MSACQTEAIRGAIAPATEEPESRLFLAAALEDVDRLLFEAAALAPRGGVLRRALEGLALREDIDAVADPDLFDLWALEVGRVLYDFTIDPASWPEPEAARYLADCAAAFELRSDRAPELIQRFHGLKEDERFAVLLHLQPLEPFRFLAHQIANNRTRRPLASTDASVRRLLRLLERDS